MVYPRGRSLRIRYLMNMTWRDLVELKSPIPMATMTCLSPDNLWPIDSSPMLTIPSNTLSSSPIRIPPVQQVTGWLDVMGDKVFFYTCTPGGTWHVMDIF
ncbi:hypothetical protein SeLEV6574_g06699 [Synchytrium endobioticum]|uniref:Uncharacterized protein n=1 Tax=Synchytrium endobioticum TaxID=286115 RepID=A0A507CKK4_9FUNG|nr:hypothetical protein SeLEV6574_g06699 [Synchytrium endobioticum]